MSLALHPGGILALIVDMLARCPQIEASQRIDIVHQNAESMNPKASFCGPVSVLTNSVFKKNARFVSADCDPRTASSHSDHGADEEISLDWRKRPGTSHADVSIYSLSRA